MNFRPLNDRILIERFEEELNPVGIIIPDNAKEKPTRGKVIAVGKGKQLDNGTICSLLVKCNDIVVFGKYAGYEVKVDGKEYIVMNEADILGVIE